MKFSFLGGRFGEEPLFEMKQDEVDVVSRHYKQYLSEDWHTLDDITWNDLAMDDIFKMMNATYSGAGDLVLYGMFRQPCLKQAELNRRVAIMDWAKQHEDEREDAIQILYDAQKRFLDDLDQPLQENYGKQKRALISRIITAGLGISILLSILNPQIFVFVAIAFLLISIFRYWTLHKQLENHLDAMVYTVDHIEALHKLAKEPFTGLEELKDELMEVSKQLHTIRKKSSFGYFDSASGAMNSITQNESILFDRYAELMYGKQDVIRKAFALVGRIDACIAIASYQVYKQVNTNVSLEEKGRFIDAKAMIHPLLKKAVANDVDIHENRLITGSNATGKSTYLKMIAINAILAQSFHIVYAKSYRASFFQIATSMTLHDNLEEHESTFVVEVKSLKHLLDLCDHTIPALCVVDEILRGTNTLERIAASSVILHSFAQRNCICLGATHDMELTHMLQEDFANYHFTEMMKGDKMSFDYKIHTGPTKTRNAIALLKTFAYDPRIVEHAKKRLSDFETTGIWSVVP